jgi:cytoskeletal protein RodZ
MSTSTKQPSGVMKGFSFSKLAIICFLVVTLLAGVLTYQVGQQVALQVADTNVPTSLTVDTTTTTTTTAAGGSTPPQTSTNSTLTTTAAASTSSTTAAATATPAVVTTSVTSATPKATTKAS